MIITEHNKKPSRKYRRAIKLFKWQDHKCPYTNETIAMGEIFHGQAVLDHILPWEETQDDSLSNLVLCKKRLMMIKVRTPHLMLLVVDMITRVRLFHTRKFYKILIIALN